MRRTVVVRALLILVAGSLTLAPAAGAIPLLPDTFEDGTTMGWFVPDLTHPSPPANIADGGPAGAGDAYLQIAATGGSGSGSRLSVLNDAQWTGDYLAAGVTAITMDVNNFGPDDIVLRLLLENLPAAPGPPEDLAITLADITVPGGSGWTSVMFDLSAANLAALVGSVDGALGEVNVLRIFHNPVASHPGPMVGPPPVIATVGIDNITALTTGTPVPEPFAGALVTFGVAAWLARRRVRPASR